LRQPLQQFLRLLATNGLQHFHRADPAQFVRQRNRPLEPIQKDLHTLLGFQLGISLQNLAQRSSANSPWFSNSLNALSRTAKVVLDRSTNQAWILAASGAAAGVRCLPRSNTASFGCFTSCQLAR